MTYDEVLGLDKQDPLTIKRQEFALPEGLIYLDGNSLGALPKAAQIRAQEVVSQQWGQDLIQSWNKHQWIDLPLKVGEKIAPLLGAAPGQVICCDSISVNLFKLISGALLLQQGRTVVLSTEDNFPTDLYMVQGLTELVGQDHCQLKLVDEEQIVASLDENVALLVLTQVNFRSGKLLDMQKITNLAHDKGILVIWDLAHSAGALPLELDRCSVDFAVGCGYKYLNGGPGAPAFVYVAERHQQSISQPLRGWMGHKSPFAFAPEYQASSGVLQYLCGTPPILSMSVLDSALSVFEGVELQALRDKSLALADLLLTVLQEDELRSELVLYSPSKGEERGSQLAFQHPHAYSICQALMDKGVVTDFRAPNILRFGFSPLYISFEDIWRTGKIVRALILSKEYKAAKYQIVQKVT